MEPPRTHDLHARLFLLSRSSGLVSPSTPVSRLTCLFACSQFVLSTVLSVFSVHVSARLFLVYKHLYGFGLVLFSDFSIGSHSTSALEQAVLCLFFFCLIHTKGEAIRAFQSPIATS